MSCRLERLIAVLVSTAAAAGPALAQTYPNKPVRMVLSGPAGGGADVVARPVAQRMSELMGQPVNVDNRPGAGGLVAAQIALAAPPDGYTLFFTTASSFNIAPFLQKKPPYDPVRDFTPVTLVALAPLVVAVHPSLPVKSVKELIALARSRPDGLFYASNGKGSLSHIATEMFSSAARIRMVHVPYKGGAPAVMDTVSGQVQLIITAVPTLIGQVKAGRLRALAVTGLQRTPALPELPAVAEAALPGFDVVQWYGLFAPAGTPAALIDRIYAEVSKAVTSPGVAKPLAQEGAELSASGPRVLEKFLPQNIAKWQKAILDAKLAAD